MTGPGQIPRRRFFRAAAAPPLLIPAAALGSGGRAAPNERIGLGLIGAGPRGSAMFRDMARHPGVEPLGACDVEDSRLQQFRREGLAVWKDFREMLARDELDAVVIASPTHWKPLHTIAAAKAGKDVFCEKPMSLTVRDGRAMVTAIRRYGRVYQHGTQQRSAPEFRFACEMVRNGRIGQLKSVTVYVGGPPSDCYLPGEPVPKGLDWDMWLGPAPWRPFHPAIYRGWEGFRDYSGGGMTGWGSHHFDIAQWGLGADETGPVEVIPPDGKEVRLLTFRYASGVPVIHANQMGQWAVVFEGSEGKVAVNRGRLQTWPASIMRKPTAPDELHLYESPGHNLDFLQAIRTRQRPAADVEIGHRTMTVCHLGNIGFWLRRPLKWDPAKEEFIDDPPANRLLDRPRRAPWTL